MAEASALESEAVDIESELAEVELTEAEPTSVGSGNPLNEACDGAPCDGRCGLPLYDPLMWLNDTPDGRLNERWLRECSLCEPLKDGWPLNEGCGGRLKPLKSEGNALKLGWEDGLTVGVAVGGVVSGFGEWGKGGWADDDQRSCWSYWDGAARRGRRRWRRRGGE